MMNAQQLTRIGLVYFKEAVLEVLREGKESGEGAVKQVDIFPRMGLPLNLGRTPWFAAYIFMELKKEKRIFAHRNAAGKVIRWELADPESDTL